MRVIISGGGTGGHIFPAIAIANTIKQHNNESEILFVGAEGRMEMQKVPQSGYRIIGLKIAGFNRKNILKNVSLPFKLLACSLKCKRIIKEFKPDIVIGVGGYASFSVVNMAQKMKIPTLLQEQNSLAGKSNQLLGKKAKKICVAYDNMDRYFSKDKIVLTGNPIRQNILEMDGCKYSNLGFVANKTVLVTGGSLGAGTINWSIEKILEYFIDNNIRLIWQTGSYYYKDIVTRLQYFFFSNQKAKELIEIKEFISDMAQAYSLSDVIIARAGALSISELCVVGKPTILIPSPNVAEDHQTKNARTLADKNATLMIKDEDLSNDVNILSASISKLLKDSFLQQTLSNNIRQMAILDATERIYVTIMDILDNKN
ncbi:MAG: undecaprenyldiphospho-muramoylpentapeptide beta-N-acetylglucosaminyltransferase [Bacteroidales bacterium]